MSWGVVQGGDSEVDRAGAGGAGFELGDFLLSGDQADLESFGLAEPSLVFGFLDALAEVVADLQEPRALFRVGPQERAANAPLTELTTMF